MKVIGNGYLFTLDDQLTSYEDGAVAIKGDRILAVGTTKDICQKYPEASFTDAQGSLILPGFINVHHHIYSAMARGVLVENSNPKTFIEVLEDMWWNIDAHLNEDSVRYSAYSSMVESLKNGVTCLFDHHASFGKTKGSLDILHDVAEEVGMRTCLCYEVSDRHGEDKMLESIDENVHYIKRCERENTNMHKALFGLHASFTLSDKTLELCEEKRPKGVGYHVHVAEGMADVIDARENHHMLLAKRLDKFNLLGPDTLCVHGILLNDEEMNLIARTNTMLAHNPESNMANAVGAPPMYAYMKKGVLVGLGTDGYTCDMLESYKVANCLMKHREQDPSVGWVEIPKMLFENNRKIAKRVFDEKMGVLEEGALADIIIMDYEANTPLHTNNLYGHLLFGANGNMVNSTMIAGKWVMRDRQVLTVNEMEILKKSRASSQELWNRMNGG